MTTLKTLFDLHLTDKGIHGYQTLYERLLPDPNVVTSVLEVGIGTLDPDAVSTTVGSFPETYCPGASLRAWRDYFPNAVVWGLDPAPDCMFDDEDRIVTKLCDSTDDAQVFQAVPSSYDFDLIVDDGDHQRESQMMTLANLWPYVRPGGWYVIEDVYIANIYTLAGVVDKAWHSAILQPSQSWWFFAIAIPKPPA